MPGLVCVDSHQVCDDFDIAFQEQEGTFAPHLQGLKFIEVPAGMGTAVENPPLGRLFERLTPILPIGNHGSDPAVFES